MRKILFLVLVASVVGMGGEHAKTSSPTNKPDEKKERKEGEGLSEKTSDVLGSATDLEQNLDNPDFKEKIEGLSPDEKEELKTEIEKRQLETADNEQKKRFQLVLELLDQKEKEETQSSTSSSKPAGTHLQTTGGKVIGRDGKIDVYRLPSGFEVHLDPQGRKTIDGQSLVVIGKEGATKMDGLFPASAFGLQVGTKGEISIDPKPSMLTVSGNNGPKINSAVPVIFNDKGDAFARQGMLDEKGNQTLYWANGSGDVFSSVGKNGGEIVTVSKEKLPAVLEARGTDSGKYLAVKAQPAEETPSGVFTVAQMVEELGRPSFPGINQSPPKRSSPDAPPKASLESIMQEFSKTRELFAPAPSTPEVTPVEASSASPRDSLTQSAVSASPCANGKCNLQAAPTTRRRVCTARGCFFQ
jgi:hypothetical protein